MNKSRPKSGGLPTPAVLAVAVGLVAGCGGRATLLPNAEPSLNRPRAQLQADAASRFAVPFDSLSPAGHADARAEIGYGMREIRLANLSDDAIEDVAVWINRTHVVGLPGLGGKRAVVISFNHFFDQAGNPFDTAGGKNLVRSLELVHGGNIHTVTTQVAR